MRIFNRSTLQDFWKRYPDAEQALRAWHHEVENASWESPAEIRQLYGTADFVANNRVVFDIRGNNYRIIVAVKYGPIFCVYEVLNGHRKLSLAMIRALNRELQIPLDVLVAEKVAPPRRARRRRTA